MAAIIFFLNTTSLTTQQPLPLTTGILQPHTLSLAENGQHIHNINNISNNNNNITRFEPHTTATIYNNNNTTTTTRFGPPLPPSLDPDSYGDHVDFFHYSGDIRQLTLPWVREANFVPVVIVQLVTLILGVFGNGLVIHVLCCGRPGRCVTFPCLLSVAVADVLFLVVCIPHEVMSHFLTDWRLSVCLCKVSGFVEMVSALAAVLNLVLISLERYFVIAHPLLSKSLCTPRKAKIALAFTWISAVLLSTPAFLVMDTEVNIYYNNTTYAAVVLCGDYGWRNTGRTAWAVWQLMLLLLLPALLLLFCYIRVILILWTSTRHLHTMTASGYRSANSSSSRNGARDTSTAAPRGWKVGGADRSLLPNPSSSSAANRSSSSASSYSSSSMLSRNPGEEAMHARKQVIRMLVVIVVVFLVCWGPHLIINLVKRLQVTIYVKATYHVWVMFSCLPYLQSVINPVIYVLMSRNLRRSILASPCLRCFRHCCCRCCSVLRLGRKRHVTTHELLMGAAKHGGVAATGAGNGSGGKGSGSGSGSGGGGAEMKTALETMPSYGASEFTEV